MNKLYWAKVKADAKVPQKRYEDAGYDLYPCFEEDYMVIEPHDEQESDYHGFVTGLVSGFADYEVLSNIESGEGRFDLVVKQRSDAEYAAILEFKIAKTYKEMSAKCDEALRQIETCK